MMASKGPRKPRRARSSFTTKSGNTIKLNQTFGDRLKTRKMNRATAKAAYLSTLPKDKWKRVLYRLHPRRIARYWFSREGAIMALKITGVAIVLCFFLTIGLFAYFRKDLPQIKDLAGRKLGGSNTYYDRSGNTVLWQDYDAVKRIGVSSKDISPYMKQATIAIEDKDFYKHGAFDVRGIMRAGLHDVFGGGGSVQGGSTITQQLVKLNEQWTTNRTVARKVKELILAVELEREYSKDDILTGYLNIAPYGGIEYGAETAARDYFHTDAKSLTLAQAATLAAMPQAPSYYSPYSSTEFNPAAGNTFNKQALLNRQHYILDQMVKQKMISKAQADEAKKVDIIAQIQPLQSKYQGIKAPYFVLAAKQELEEKYGAATVQRGGWKIITTLDLNLQNAAEQAVANNYSSMQRLTGRVADEAATVAEDVQTGQIAALVGGTNFDDPDHGKINYAAQSLIPPGSSFKPYDYVTLIDNNNNVGAGSVLYDTQGPIPGYPCTNKNRPKNDDNANCLWDYDFVYPGPLTLRYAMGGSRNVPAVKAMLSAVPNDTSNGKVSSVNKVISTASAMMDNGYLEQKHRKTYNCYAQGVDINNATDADITQCYGASAIGDGAFLHLDDHVNGLATLARLGNAIPRTYILKITDAANKQVYQFVQPKGKQVIKPDSAYIVNDMASDPNASYLPGSCSATNCTPLSRGGYKFHRDNGWTFAIKTGTTNNGFDGLMTSWSSKYAVVSWVGNHTRNKNLSAYANAAMETLTEPITRAVMEAAHANLKPVNWEKPQGLKSLPAFVVRNHIHFGDIEPSPSNDLFPSWYVGNSGNNTSQTMDKVSGKVATNCTPPFARDVQTNSNAASWNVDIFNGGHTSINTGAGTTGNQPVATDDVHNCNDSPPSITLTAPADCKDTDNGGEGCTITATVSAGTHALSDPTTYPQFPGTINFTLNGQSIKTVNVNDSPTTFSFNYKPTSSGSGTLTATVTDSVLYQGSDSATVNFTVTPPPVEASLNFDSAKINGTNTKFSWSGGVGPYSVFRSDNNLTLCSNVSGTTCQVPKASALAGTSVYVQDSTGKKATTTVTN
ncbi:MAG TPA: transglycosylase domain-containing protein [Candidatus Saccharimonadales bacterium]|nr:transglycosylase domain-containing protein [Candidatus Saccharimonadales bacterium]